MKILSILALFIFTGYLAVAQQKNSRIHIIDTTKQLMLVETACGQCQFGMKAKGCSLAVRINGKSYFVDGTSIDDHGDAHAADGFCNAIRKARVQGKITRNRFAATYLQLVEN